MSFGRTMVFALLTLSLGCMKPGPIPVPAFPIHIFYKNQSGDDLLNPLTQGHFNKDVISVANMTLQNGVTKEKDAAYDQSISCANYCCLSASTGYYYVDFFARPADVGALIHIDPSKVDTLVFVSTGRDVSKIQYKGQVIWTGSSLSSLVVNTTIVK
jgi:hypothetical protein